MSDDTIITMEKVFSPKLEKIFRILTITAALLVAGELVWFFLISPCMPLSSVEIKGVFEIDRNTILAQAGIDERSSFMSVNPRTMEKVLGALPQIETARVVKNFPSQVEITVTGRTALVSSLARINGRQALVIIDRYGVVFKIVNPGDAAAMLPLISGLNFDNVVLGSKLQAESLCSFLSRFSLIRDSAPELFAAISELRINRKVFQEGAGRSFETFDLTLYLSHKPVKILAGADLNEETLRYILLTADVLMAREPRLDEIDFRAGIASYTLKEASSG
ncbi:cell division protein FtsQ [Spirochaetia bacterium]|nr:cell division protein FtsQ [Spirochaetia bacterium]